METSDNNSASQPTDVSYSVERSPFVLEDMSCGCYSRSGTYSIYKSWAPSKERRALRSCIAMIDRTSLRDMLSRPPLLGFGFDSSLHVDRLDPRALAQVMSARPRSRPATVRSYDMEPKDIRFIPQLHIQYRPQDSFSGTGTNTDDVNKSPTSPRLLPKRFRCSVCYGIFITRSSLRRHEVIHLQDRSFVCTFGTCSKSFSRKRDLQAHQRFHTKDQPYQCPVESCGFRFIHKSSLREHERRDHQTYKTIKRPSSQPSEDSNLIGH